MLEFTKIGKHWFIKSKGYWNIEFVGKIRYKADWNTPMECIYEFPKEEGIIKKFVVELPRERLRDHYRVYMEELGDNKIKVGFQLLKEEDLSDWQLAHGGFNVRVWVHAYETLPNEFVASVRKYSKVYHKGNCYIVKRIKTKITQDIPFEGKRLCKRCENRK